MTVSTTATETDYDGDDSTVEFSFTFSCDAATDLAVYVSGVKQTSGVTVTLNADQSENPGGSVTFDAAPATGSGNVRLARETPKVQGAAYDPYAAFPAATHERALDLLTLMAQEAPMLVQVPVTSSSSGSRGSLAADADYLYVCVATDTWKRTALATF